MKPSPSYRNKPDAMNPAAEEVWRSVVKKFADDIYQSKNLVEQWRAAKNHFERVCAQRKIKPYDPLLAMVKTLVKISRSI